MTPFKAREIACGLTCLWLATVGAAGQTRDLRPDLEQEFSQRIDGGAGLSFEVKSLSLPERRSASFEIPGPVAGKSMKAAQAGELRETLLARINTMHSVVRDAVGGVDGKPRASVDAILAALDAARNQATGNLRTDLDNLLIAAKSEVRYEDAANPGREALFKVWSFRLPGERDPATTRLCGPKIVVRPGTILLIPMLNLLEKEDLAIDGFAVPDHIPFRADPINRPHGFDVINLHTHGLNVSPMWPADDVFREIHPFQLKFFIYEIPADHPVGTFWYHPHKHGAVAAHVSGGMAGALIVAGEPGNPLGLDKIGVSKGWVETDEPLLLQQITQYLGKADSGKSPIPFVSRPDFIAVGGVGNLEKGENLQGDLKPLGELIGWMKANLEKVSPPAQTWLSGRLNPILQSHEGGQTYRLRLIHAGIRQNWTFDIAPKGQKDKTAVGARIQAIAWDGLPLEAPYELEVSDGKRTPLTLSPGNRADVLVWFPENTDGDFSIVARYGSGPTEIGSFHIRPGTSDQPRFLAAGDIAGILKPVPAENGPAIAFSGQGSSMRVSLGANGIPSFNDVKFEINKSPFPGTAVVSNLGKASRVTYEVAFHPIHIHVNPVLMDPDPARKHLGQPVGRYWTDTFYGDLGTEKGIMPLDHWVGKSVVHCHILDHEDNGMMNVFEIRNSLDFPVLPVINMMEMLEVPAVARASMKSAWPSVSPDPVPPAGIPTVYIFLPRPADVASCAHCTGAAIGIAGLRKTPGMPDFRIVAVTGSNVGQLAELAEGMGLDPAKDVVCGDGDLKIFQALGLLDGTAQYSETSKQFVFPDSFSENGALKHDSDLMHGIFVASPDGFIASAYRGFLAFDDIAQIDRDIRVANRPDAEITKAEERQAIESAKSTPSLSAFQRNQSLNTLRVKERRQEFQNRMER